MTKISSTVLALGLTMAAAGCGGSGWRPDYPEAREPAVAASAEAAETLARFRQRDPGLGRFMDEAYGVAVFSTVGKGAIAVGGAHGKGEVYEQGRLVGSARVTQLSLGLALGGQSYSELIFFRDKATFDEFRRGNFELGAQASAVAVTAGASTDASWDDGVAVFTLPKGGLMYEAAVAGQKFSFTPM
ncbi:MAG: lipid-binding SYLF domain-containing protein [Polyangiaceae bacterium]|nr:lipid-binding SYLF domain-containing protein [Polyangiaceae bacterium]